VCSDPKHPLFSQTVSLRALKKMMVF
jgi:hypothetical protein